MEDSDNTLCTSGFVDDATFSHNGQEANATPTERIYSQWLARGQYRRRSRDILIHTAHERFYDDALHKSTSYLLTYLLTYLGGTSLVSRSSIRSLEFLATGHSVIALITYFPSTAAFLFRKSFPHILLWHFCFRRTRFRGLCNSSTTWATLKIAIDIDIDIDNSKHWRQLVVKQQI